MDGIQLPTNSIQFDPNTLDQIILEMVGHTFPGDPAIIVFSELSCVIARGSFCVFTGESGSGKTTLLNLIAGLDIPSNGTIKVFGVNLIDLDEPELAEWRLNNIGYVFQSYNLISTFTAKENLTFPLELLHPDKELEELDIPVEDMLEAVGLQHRISHLPHQLSGGEQQRLALARALVTDPPIILADEPTGNLDEKTAQKIRDILYEFNQNGKTILVATHDRKLIELSTQITTLT